MKNNCTALIPVWESGIINNILLPTCEIIKDYFKKIVILHCGIKENMNLYDAYKHINNLNVELFNYGGESEAIMKRLGTFVPENEWGLVLDSDQRPTNMLLTNLDNSISFLDENGYGFASFPTFHHEYCENGSVQLSGNPPPQTEEEVYKNHTYTVKSLLKMNKDFTVYSNKGMHYYFGPKNIKSRYFPYGINHYKLIFEYYSSIFLCGYTNPLVHSDRKEHFDLDEKNKDIYRQFEELKKETGLFISNDFQEKAYRNEIPSKFIQFFSNPMFAKVNNPNTTLFLNNGYIFCTKYNFSFSESLSNKRYCGNSCCKYNGGQF